MRRRPHVSFHSLVAGLALLSVRALVGFGGMREAPPPSAVAMPGVPANGPMLITNYCASCHQAGRARIDLDGRVDRRRLRRDPDGWLHVMYALESGDMPPSKAPQPSPADRRLMIGWIEEQLASLDADRNCHLVVRRLTRQEYGNAMRDLLGTTWQPPTDFPADDAEWDLAAALPGVPAPLKQSYEGAADGLLAAAYLEARLAAMDAPPHASARTLLAAMARRAFRGPVTADEATRLNVILDEAVRAGIRPAHALRSALRDVLTSARFLYHIERRADNADPSSGSETTDYELAARLAAFLWRSIPDDTLLQLADAGRLRMELTEQTRRMLRDPRAAAFAADFAAAWLGLDQLDSRAELPAKLRQAMRQETEYAIAHVIEQDRSVLEFLDADYTFLNEPLAAHYGIAAVRGMELRRVSVKATPRGGLVTHASFLAMTGPAAVASPVQRGKWILTNLLGTPPPAPPAGALDGFFQPAAGTGLISMHQALAKHREHSSCAACHAQLDALGLALTEFDNAGAWRPQPEPDEWIVLPDGERLRSVADLKSYLLHRRALFLRALGGKLLTYALGRKLPVRDRPALERLAARTLLQPRFGNLLLEVVHSAPFQRRAWEP